MSKRGILVIGFIITCFVMMTQMVFGWMGVGTENARLVNTGNSVSYGFDAHPSFYSNSSRFFYFATRTGMRFINSNGQDNWSQSQQFNLTRPHMVTAGDIVAVGETSGGRVIFVFDASDELIYTVTLDNPAISFSVNEAGYLAVITQLDNGFGIYVYNRRYNIEPLYRKRISHDVNPMLIPLIAQVSADGRFIVISYWDLNQDLTLFVDFMFINQEDAVFGSDGIFAQKTFPHETPLAMRFMANNTLLLVTDSQITLYNISDDVQVQVAWSVPLHNQLDQLAFYSNNRFAFASGVPLGADISQADPVGTINIFDLNGQTGSFYMGHRVTHLRMGHNSVLAGARRYFHAINASGYSIWHHNVTHDVRDIIFLENTDTVLIAGSNRAYVWRRQRGRDESV